MQLIGAIMLNRLASRLAASSSLNTVNRCAIHNKHDNKSVNFLKLFRTRGRIVKE